MIIRKVSKKEVRRQNNSKTQPRKRPKYSKKSIICGSSNLEQDCKQNQGFFNNQHRIIVIENQKQRKSRLIDSLKQTQTTKIIINQKNTSLGFRVYHFDELTQE